MPFCISTAQLHVPLVSTSEDLEVCCCVVTLSSRVGDSSGSETTYRLHLQVLSGPTREVPSSGTSLTSKMKAATLFKMSAVTDPSTQRSNPEHLSPQPRHCAKLKLHLPKLSFFHRTPKFCDRNKINVMYLVPAASVQMTT